MNNYSEGGLLQAQAEQAQRELMEMDKENMNPNTMEQDVVNALSQLTIQEDLNNNTSLNDQNNNIGYMENQDYLRQRVLSVYNMEFHINCHENEKNMLERMGRVQDHPPEYRQREQLEIFETFWSVEALVVERHHQSVEILMNASSAQLHELFTEAEERRPYVEEKLAQIAEESRQDNTFIRQNGG